jgi:IS5 family transposase
VGVLTNKTPQTCYVDRGYRGHGVEKTRIIIAGQKRGISNTEQRWLKRRNSVEPIIGHLKADGRMRRCYLKGVQGDALNVLLCACGQNLRKLLKWLSWAEIYKLFLQRFNRIELRYVALMC